MQQTKREMEEWKMIAQEKATSENIKSQVLVLQEKLPIIMMIHKDDKSNLEVENVELKEELYQEKEALK